jgi:hypothetical protein
MLTTTATATATALHASGGIHMERGVGSLFLDLNDADAALQQLEQQTASSGSRGQALEVSATSLDDVYYPLIAQKGKVAPSGMFNHLNIPN